MKLRMREGSLRLRLTRREVQALQGTGEVVENLDVAPGARLSWSIAASGTATSLGASLEGSWLRVVAPAAWIAEWAASEERVGLEGRQEVGTGALKILIEKDWACLAPREDEDDGDAFPHPGKASSRTSPR
jgi:hypothetical protein